MSASRPARRLALLAAALVLSSGPAAAFRKDPRQQGDAARFGLDKPEPPAARRLSFATRTAGQRYKVLQAGGARLRYNPRTGVVAALSGRIFTPQAATPQAAAEAFLEQNKDVLAIDPRNLKLSQTKDSAGMKHLLFEQTLNGLPVEFSRVKVHFSADGQIVGLHSSYVPDASVSSVPGVAQRQAAQAVARDLGAAPPAWGSLSYLPVYKTGQLRLAWKFKASGPGGVWVYYVDAQTAEILFRYNNLRFAVCPSGTSGTVVGQVYDLDPSSGPLVYRGIPNEKVYVYSNVITTFAVTAADGSFCNPGTAGKIYTGLQGSFVNVANFHNNSLHYDNGGGTWFIANTPVSSPHPYPNAASFPAGVVSMSAINVVTPPSPPFAPGSIAVKMMPHFSSFQVGALDSELVDIASDDQAEVLDPDGNPVGSYIGSQAPFNGAAAQGCQPCDAAAGKTPLRIRLSASQTGGGLGFDVNISSVLVLTNSPATAANPSNVVWAATSTVEGAPDEVMTFYHLNKMHDYFMADIDKSSAAYISSPTVAVVHFGPGLANAFYNPDHNNFAIGDGGAAIALDATVIHHEYVHFVIDKIFPIAQFGQAGAVSEAIADYFSASSLNDPHFGRFVSGSFGGEASLRELACAPNGSPLCRTYPANWVGEIHDDSPMLSQALWEIRTDLVGLLGQAAGQSCADGLVFQSLFFFPESFQEFLDAMLLVDGAGQVSACGGAGTQKAEILARFSNHGIVNVSNGDANEFNNGAQSAVDISTRPAVTGTIFPAGNQDYYVFAAGPGLIQASLVLPQAPGAPSAYLAYGMTLLDRQLRVVAEAYPVVDNPSAGGGCPNVGCRTAQPQVALLYNNPSPNQFYIVVQSAAGDSGSPSGTSDPALQYALLTNIPEVGSLPGGIVSAVFDNDAISYTVNVAKFSGGQNASFAFAQLRDQSLNVLANTQTNGVAPFLSSVSSSGTNGVITGVVRLAPGFSARFPSVGTVFLEVFGLNALQLAKAGSGDPAMVPKPQSLGLSSPINLTATAGALTAWNNVFNPRAGQRATFKYELASPGHATLRLYQMNGQLVTTLVDGDYPAGKGAVDWAGTNASGRTVASGVYLLRLEGPGVSQTQKVVVIK